MFVGMSHVRRIAKGGAIAAAIATMGVAGVTMLSSNAYAAHARNGQWYHKDVAVRSGNAAVQCISMQFPGGGKTYKAKVSPRSYGSLGQGVFHYNDGFHQAYTFSTYTSSDCTGDAVKTTHLQDPEDSFVTWWVTL